MRLRIGVFALVIGLMSACADEVVPEPELTEPTTDFAVASDDDASAHEMAQSLPLPLRLAFMSGHVEAGLALYRAGEPEMAAKHLLHPVSETHAEERIGLDALGFRAALFEVVSIALDSGVEAAAIEPQLSAAEQNLAMVSKKAGGDPEAIIRFLMETVLEEYAVGVRDGRITDPGEYQDAYGFTVVALQRSESLPATRQASVSASLSQLLEFWQGAPRPVERPATVAAVERQVAKVMHALNVE